MIHAKTTMMIEISVIEIINRGRDKFRCRVYSSREGQLNTLYFCVEDIIVYMDISRELSLSWSGIINCDIEVKLDCNGENPAMYIRKVNTSKSEK